MRIVLQDGPRKFELGRIVDGKGGGGRFHDATTADQFLRRFRDDPGAMMKLRQLAGDIAAPTFHRLGDRELLKYLAHSMARGRILLLSEAAPERQTMAVDEAPPEAPPPPAARSAASAPPSAPREPATFPVSFDAIAQAAALRSAAQDGTPFCEECERARQARAGQAA